MEAEVAVRRLGMRGLAGLAGEGRVIVRANGVWIALGVIAMLGIDKLAPSSIEGTAFGALAAVVLAGTFAWMQRWQQGTAPPFPAARLLWLGVAITLLMLPLIGLLAATQLLAGVVFLGLTSYVHLQTGAIVSIWFSVFLESLPALAFMLAFCLAPALVAARGVRPGAAVAASFKAWTRNPAALALGLLLWTIVFAVRAVPLWAVIRNPPLAALIQSIAVALCATLAAAPMVAFHGRVFDVAASGDQV